MKERMAGIGPAAQVSFNGFFRSGAEQELDQPLLCLGTPDGGASIAALENLKQRFSLMWNFTTKIRNLWFGSKPQMKSWMPSPGLVNALMTQDSSLRSCNSIKSLVKYPIPLTHTEPGCKFPVRLGTRQSSL